MFRITRHLDKAWNLLVAEVNKCQLLCHPCHIEKTRINGENPGGATRKRPLTHGTTHAYYTYKCRCELCREAKRIDRQNRKGMPEREWGRLLAGGCGDEPHGGSIPSPFAYGVFD